jgi:hypothetical protein
MLTSFYSTLPAIARKNPCLILAVVFFHHCDGFCPLRVVRTPFDPGIRGLIAWRKTVYETQTPTKSSVRFAGRFFADFQETQAGQILRRRVTRCLGGPPEPTPYINANSDFM